MTPFQTMKQLFLIRHAESSWNHPQLADIDSPLKKGGKRDASVMGERLRSMKIKPHLILSSPAKRALSTANIISKEIGYPKDDIIIEDSIYSGGVSNLIELIQNIDDSLSCVFLFGHNPDLNALARQFTSYDLDNIPTCGVFCINFQTGSWSKITAGSGNVAFFDYPKASAG